MLEKDPKNRIGVKNKNEIKIHPFFEEINWEKLENKEIEPPILKFPSFLDENKNHDYVIK